jgi:outer membrane murein-binding lipoprotein Lpp
MAENVKVEELEAKIAALEARIADLEEEIGIAAPEVVATTKAKKSK